MKYTAIVLAAGAGKRMKSKIHKQYLTLAGKPGEIPYCRQEIINKYGFQKISAIVEGGKERYHSVYEGLKAAEGTDYVLIHDGARPFVDKDMISRIMKEVAVHQACIAGMPVKDTIKIADANGYVNETPDRRLVWQVQTPQAFSYPLIRDAYAKMLKNEDDAVTDDAMVLERMTCHKTKLVEGSYRNIKITTPEDLVTAEAYLRLQ
jgi:2-C-methyl-D-erythritol 4-phosphate cytidylyltransferase